MKLSVLGRVEWWVGGERWEKMEKVSWRGKSLGGRGLVRERKGGRIDKSLQQWEEERSKTAIC